MSKHHLQNLAEQLAQKGHASAPFHHEQLLDSSIKLRAYQIHLEKGGSDLDNWLEAEQSLKNIDKAVSSLINEGDPNIQR